MWPYSGSKKPRFRPLSSFILSFQKYEQNSLDNDTILNLQGFLATGGALSNSSHDLGILIYQSILWMYGEVLSSSVMEPFSYCCESIIYSTGARDIY